MQEQVPVLALALVLALVLLPLLRQALQLHLLLMVHTLAASCLLRALLLQAQQPRQGMRQRWALQQGKLAVQLAAQRPLAVQRTLLVAGRRMQPAAAAAAEPPVRLAAAAERGWLPAAAVQAQPAAAACMHSQQLAAGMLNRGSPALAPGWR